MTSPDSLLVTSVHLSCIRYTNTVSSNNGMNNDISPFCTSVTWLTRALLFAILITINSLALGLNLRGMTQMGSTLGTILSTGTNFASSAFLGYILFQEQLSLQWWIGAGFITIGTLLISLENNKTETSVSESSTKKSHKD